jgi:hypothetical protein
LMSPLALKVLLHYYVTPLLFEKNSAHDLELEAITEFIRQDLIKWRAAGDVRDGHHALEITDRGRAYVEAILATPYPVIRWVIP